MCNKLLKRHQLIGDKFNIEFLAGYISKYQGPLCPEEKLIIANSPKKRRSEFTAGRCMLRSAFKNIGININQIGMDDNGCPIFPEGVIGCITHTDTKCVVAAGRNDKFTSIGLDLEKIGRVEDDMWGMLFSHEEIRFLKLLPFSKMNIFSTIIYCAKESYIKQNYFINQTISTYEEIYVSISNISNDNFIRFNISLLNQVDRTNSLTGVATYDDDFVLVHIVNCTPITHKLI